MMHWGSFGWGMGFGWTYMVIFWAVILTAFAFLVRAFTHRSDCSAYHEAPPYILKRRYAKGEITRDEYDRMKEDLKKA